MISLNLEYVFRNENAYENLINEIRGNEAEPWIIDLLLELLERGREQYRKDKEFARWLESNA